MNQSAVHFLAVFSFTQRHREFSDLMQNRADRGPRAGSPRGVVVATGCRHLDKIESDLFTSAVYAVFRKIS